MIEQFHGTPADGVRAAFGTTFTWIDAEGRMGIVPVVGVTDLKGVFPTTNLILSDPALVRKLIDELSVALTALEASRG